jgi:hypothetical protein
MATATLDTHRSRDRDALSQTTPTGEEPREMTTKPTTCQLRGCDQPAAVPFTSKYGPQDQVTWHCTPCNNQYRRNLEILDRYPY